MTRRRSRSGRSRYQGGGEESSTRKILAGIGLFIVLSLGAGMGIYFVLVKSERDQIDTATFCPKDGPLSVTTVLIDRTDGINAVQGADLRDLLLDTAAAIPPHGQLRIYEVTASEGLAAPIVSVCNPGSAKDGSFFDENLKRKQQKYEERFKGPIDDLIRGMKTDAKADSSPIMEAIQEISVQDFANENAVRKLLVVSDLMQHTASFSLYKDVPDVEAFRASAYGRKVEPDLLGVEIELHILVSSSGKQNDEVGMFWFSWLTEIGANLLGSRTLHG